MVKFLIICLLFFYCLTGKAQDSCQYYQKYIDSGSTIIKKGGDSADFIKAIAQHRFWDRENESKVPS